MKVGTSRFFVVAAIAVLSIVGGVTPVLAQNPNFPDFSSLAGLTLSGNAGQNGSALRLTQPLNDQVGSAWFTVEQPVKNGFSTTFQFQIGGSTSTLCGLACPGDGIAFVIQTAAVNITGPEGCGIGFGGGPCTPGGGITNSLAVEFDTFDNGGSDLNSGNHVAIQSCGMAANSVDLRTLSNGGPGCNFGNNASLLVTLADNHPHTVTITYVPPPSGSGPGKLDVILDNTDLFSGGVDFDLTMIGGLTGTNLDSAWVGFTASTGGANDEQDILNWTFTPQAQSAPVTTNVPAILNFNGGPNNNAYNYNAILTGGGVASATMTVKPILIDEEACEKLVDANPKFGKAQCFVYQNAGKDSTGTVVDSAVLFEVTCPGQPGGTCGDTGPANFFADLGSDFSFTKAENPGFQLLNSTIGPYPGWLKGSGPDPLQPCTPNSDTTIPLFQSNQITSFSVVGDPLGTTKGKSGGGASCWVATFFTAGEVPPGIKITTPKLTTYTKGSSVTASYTCSDPKTSKLLPPSAVGPYLTASTCSQSQAPNLNNGNSCSGNVSGIITCTGGVDTSVKGLHAFTVKAKDSGGNVNVNVVIYNVR